MTIRASCFKHGDHDGEQCPKCAAPALCDMTDKQLAGRVRMLLRTDLDHEAVCTFARDRILALSAEVERLPANRPAVVEGLCKEIEDLKIDIVDNAARHALEITAKRAGVERLREALREVGYGNWSDTDDAGQLRQIMARMQEIARSALSGADMTDTAKRLAEIEAADAVRYAGAILTGQTERTFVCDVMRALLANLNAALAGKAAAERALRSATGYLLNAKIDLETGCPKATAIKTIEGGLAMIRAAPSDAKEPTT